MYLRIYNRHGPDHRPDVAPAFGDCRLVAGFQVVRGGGRAIFDRQRETVALGGPRGPGHPDFRQIRWN